MVNGIIYIIHDILLMDTAINVFIFWKHTFLNELLFYFILIIFISSDIPPKETHEVSNLVSVSIIGAPYKNIQKKQKLSE